MQPKSEPIIPAVPWDVPEECEYEYDSVEEKYICGTMTREEILAWIQDNQERAFNRACRGLITMMQGARCRPRYFHHTCECHLVGAGPIIQGSNGIPRWVTQAGRRWANTLKTAHRVKKELNAGLHIPLRPEPRTSWSNRILAPLRAFWRVLTK